LRTGRRACWRRSRDPLPLAGAIDLLLSALDLRERSRVNAWRTVEASFDLRCNALASGRERRAVMARERCATGEETGFHAHPGTV
jgi:hypothetical protein